VTGIMQPNHSIKGNPKNNNVKEWGPNQRIKTKFEKIIRDEIEKQFQLKK